MHSYLGRCLLSRLSYADFVGYLDTTIAWLHADLPGIRFVARYGEQ